MESVEIIYRLEDLFMEYRIEKDTIGEIKVPADRYWGAQTQRSYENFKIGVEKMPKELIRAFIILKKSAAKANFKLGKLSEEKKNAIEEACTKLLSEDLYDHFPLVVWQTGSGTQSNMNVNEVIAHIGNEILASRTSNVKLHPNDDVNMSQSSNDTFPTAMHIASVLEIENQLLPTLNEFQAVLKAKQEECEAIIKIGRTHLQDATPLTLGQEISGWLHMIEKSSQMIQESLTQVRELAIGGTAVGTGINSHPKFGETVANIISEETGTQFRSAKNKFYALTSHDQLVFLHGALKGLAADMMKIANDIRWLASGPRCGIGEISIPANEPGSSIMPGKVNPTQAEAVTMVACQVFGNDAAIGFAASQGNFELNVFKPVIIYNFLQSVKLLTDSIQSFSKKCVEGIKPNVEVIEHNLQNSLMLVTALNEHIGYENAAKIAKLAFKENSTLKEAALKLGILTSEQFDEWVDPKKMIQPQE